MFEDGNNCIWVILSNEGGELERLPARSEDHAREVLLKIATECPHFSHGDTIRFEEGWTEQFE
jgi:hypothetical protein